jgi:hypothetical protein
MNRKEFIKELESRGIGFKETRKEIIINHQGNVDLNSLTSLPEGVKFENGGYVDLYSLT